MQKWRLGGIKWLAHEHTATSRRTVTQTYIVSGKVVPNSMLFHKEWHTPNVFPHAKATDERILSKTPFLSPDDTS